MLIHRLMLISFLAIVSMILIDSNQGQTTPSNLLDSVSPIPPVHSSTSTTNETTTTTEASGNTTVFVDNKWMCPGDGERVLEPPIECVNDDGLCRSDKKLELFCNDKTGWCCHRLPTIDSNQKCPSTNFPLIHMVDCSEIDASVNTSGICSSSKFHSCMLGKCCPNVTMIGTKLDWPIVSFKTNITCNQSESNTTTLNIGIFCGIDDTWQFLGFKDGKDWTMVEEEDSSCVTSSNCTYGLSCVTHDERGGRCLVVVPDLPVTTTTAATTTTTPTTTDYPEEATTPDPYYSWSAYLARGWERNKVLFYLSIMFTVLGLLGTCFFWLKKKFFKWIMRPDPGEETPSERAMRLTFDAFEERLRQERRRK